MNSTSEEVYFTPVRNTENTPRVLSSFPLPPPLPISSLVIGLVTGVTGACANAVVLGVLVYARRHVGSHVNTLITNQSAMDLCACVFLSISSAMSFPAAPLNYMALGEIGNNVVCFLFRNRVLTIVGIALFCLCDCNIWKFFDLLITIALM